MPQQRFEMYRPIHKAVRHMLFSTAGALGTADLLDQASTRAMLTQLDEAIKKLKEHADHEERFVHPALESRSPGITGPFEQNHRDDELLFVELQTLGRQMESANGDQRRAVGNRIYGLFSKYVGEYLGHLDREEQQLEPALWRHFSDQELQSIDGQIMGSMPPERMAAWLPFICTSFNPDELAAIIGGVQHAAPPQVAQGLIQMAERATPPDTWARVKQRLA